VRLERSKHNLSTYLRLQVMRQQIVRYEACKSSLGPGCADRGYSRIPKDGGRKAARTSEWRGGLKLAKATFVIATVAAQIDAHGSRAGPSPSRVAFNRAEYPENKLRRLERRTSPRAFDGGKVHHF